MYKPVNTNPVKEFCVMGFDSETYQRYGIALIKRKSLRLARKTIRNNKRIFRSNTCIFDCQKNKYYDSCTLREIGKYVECLIA